MRGSVPEYLIKGSSLRASSVDDCQLTKPPSRKLLQGMQRTRWKMSRKRYLRVKVYVAETGINIQFRVEKFSFLLWIFFQFYEKNLIIAFHEFMRYSLRQKQRSAKNLQLLAFFFSLLRFYPTSIFTTRNLFCLQYQHEKIFKLLISPCLGYSISESTSTRSFTKH